MFYCSKNDSIEYIAASTGLQKNDIRKIITSEHEFIYRCLLNGCGFSISGIGMLGFVDVSEREEREMFSHLTKEYVTVPEQKRHSRVRFRPTQKLKREITEASWDKPFDLLNVESGDDSSEDGESDG